ncbi:unnamed protein product [Merluccius merluccius]
MGASRVTALSFDSQPVSDTYWRGVRRPFPRRGRKETEKVRYLWLLPVAATCGCYLWRSGRASVALRSQ